MRRDPSRRVSRAPTATEAAFIDAFERVVDMLRSATPAAEIAQEAVHGVPSMAAYTREAVQLAQTVRPALAAPLSLEYVGAYRAAMAGVQGALAKRDVVVPHHTFGGTDGVPALTLFPSFAMAQDRAIEWASEFAGNLINAMGIASNDFMKGLIEEALRRKETEAEVERLIRHSPGFGLHQRWANAVQNMQARLIAQGMPAPAVARAVAAYERRLVRARAGNIARTEILRATNAGKIQGWRDHGAAGGFERGVAEKEWRTGPMRAPTLKGRQVCPICRPLAGTHVPLDQPFLTEWGPIDHPPIHPSCRCTIVLHPLGFEGSEDIT